MSEQGEAELIKIMLRNTHYTGLGALFAGLALVLAVFAVLVSII